jgi:2'-5' RNA ligase
MRLFIAVDADEVSDYFKELQSKISFRGISLVKSFHITLHFLGEIDEVQVQGIKMALSTVKYSKIKAKISGIGFFPNEAKMRVIWAGVRPEDKIIELQSMVDDCLLPLGIKKDEMFKPHITIARIKFLKNKHDLKERVRDIKVESREFTIKSIKLMKSTLLSEGPVYETIAEFPLS